MLYSCSVLRTLKNRHGLKLLPCFIFQGFVVEYKMTMITWEYFLVQCCRCVHLKIDGEISRGLLHMVLDSYDLKCDDTNMSCLKKENYNYSHSMRLKLLKQLLYYFVVLVNMFLVFENLLKLLRFKQILLLLNWTGNSLCKGFSDPTILCFLYSHPFLCAITWMFVVALLI